MRRRTFLKQLGASGLVLAQRGRLSASDEKLNVLFLVSDDHAAYVTGLDGNPLARTPNIDGLGRQGAWCSRAYCNSPMCTPSRQSILTGRLPHATGVSILTTPLGDEETTLAEILAAQGYATAAIGKMHFNSNRTHGIQYRFDRGDMGSWYRTHPRKKVPDGVKTYGPWRPFRHPAAVWLNSEKLPAPCYDQDAPSTVFARKAGEFMRENRDRPFFLCVSFYEPHSPFYFPIEYAGSFAPEGFPVPDVAPSDREQIPAIFRPLTDAQKRGIIAASYTSTHFMDRNVGEVLEHLDKLGLEKKTLVVYYGDNGYSLGHHGRFEKHTFYEESVRVPLIFRLPGVVPRGVRMNGLIEFVDIFPTVLDFLGIPAPADTGTRTRIHGRSARAALVKGAGRFRDAVFSEYYHNDECMIRTETWKYIFKVGERTRDDGYETGNPPEGRREILFNMASDPREIHDVSREPANRDVLAKLRGRAVERFRTTWARPGDIPAFGHDDGREALRWFLTHNPDRKAT